eukprot:EG_transcript_10585
MCFSLFLSFFFLFWEPASGLDSRIINGVQVTSCPYQAKVLIKIGSSTALCGGSILSASYVLTAAHCCQEINNYNQAVSDTFTVTVGTLQLNSGGASRTADKMYIHPDWDSTDDGFDRGNDLCILHLSAPVTLSSTIAAIPIASANPAPGSTVRVTGWGSTLAYAYGSSQNSQISSVLQEASLTVLSPSTVNAWLSSSSTQYSCSANQDMAAMINFDKIIATGNAAPTVYDSCQGDSGGPLAVLNGDGSYSLVGAVSYGYGCGQPKVPAFSTSVVANAAWVQSVIAGTADGQLCNSKTCGPGAQCSSNTCVCKTGYSYSLGASDLLGYSCRRWLNGGAYQLVNNYYTMYEVFPAPSNWNSSIVHAYSPPSYVESSMGYCGMLFYGLSSSESTVVAAQVVSYASSAGFSSVPNASVWTAVASPSGGTYRAYQSASASFGLSFSNWASGEPNALGQCAMMPVNGSNAGQWDAVSCTGTSLWYVVRYRSPSYTAPSGVSSGTTTGG